MAASMAVPRYLMERDHGGRLVLPSQGFGQKPTVMDLGAHAGKPRALGDIGSVQDAESVQALPTVQEMRRRDAIAEPLNGAGEVADILAVLSPDLAGASAAPIGKSAGLIGQAAAAADDRQAIQAQADIPAGEKNTGGRGPAAGTPGSTSKKGQER